MRSVYLAAALALVAGGPAVAQTAAERFGYSAPGMYSEGTTKWNMYKFMFEDQERMEKLRAGQTGSTTPVTGETNTAEQGVSRNVDRRGKRGR